MNKDAMNSISGTGFIKITRPELPKLSGAQKTALIRKGNELFNTGQLEEAGKIFLTTGYSDGLVRLGDKYFEKHRTLDAFRMYCLAPDLHKKEMMIKKMAVIIREWVKESKTGSTIKKEGIENNG